MVDETQSTTQVGDTTDAQVIKATPTPPPPPPPPSPPPPPYPPDGGQATAQATGVAAVTADLERDAASAETSVSKLATASALESEPISRDATATFATAKTKVSQLHALMHNVGNIAEVPFEDIAGLFHELGALLGELKAKL